MGSLKMDPPKSHDHYNFNKINGNVGVEWGNGKERGRKLVSKEELRHGKYGWEGHGGIGLLPSIMRNPTISKP
jgi:hypothetical protein